jgi:peptidoglycan/xylan/chitin deacetylase (PgdA/CDA1 family)
MLSAVEHPGTQHELAGSWTRRRTLRAAAVGALALLPAAGAGAGADTRARFAAQRRALTAGAPGGLEVHWQVDVDRRLFALTFDDGPSPQYTPALLDTLAAHDAAATFFVVGRQARAHPALLRRILDAGHEVGNHTDTHLNLGTAAPAAIRRELRACHDTLSQLTGREPVLFRPPYGALSGCALRVAAEHHYAVAIWTCALRDAELDVDGTVAQAASALRPGAILLAHDAGDGHRRIGMSAIGPVLRDAAARGYRCVTVSDLLAARRRNT